MENLLSAQIQSWTYHKFPQNKCLKLLCEIIMAIWTFHFLTI